MSDNILIVYYGQIIPTLLPYKVVIYFYSIYVRLFGIPRGFRTFCAGDGQREIERASVLSAVMPVTKVCLKRSFLGLISVLNRKD